MTTVTPDGKNAERVLREAEAWIAGWAKLTSFLREHPYIADAVGRVYGQYALLSVTHHADPVGFISRVAADAVKCGAKVESYRDENHGGIYVMFGPAKLSVFAKTDKVYSQQPVGTVEYAPLFTIPGEQVSA